MSTGSLCIGLTDPSFLGAITAGVIGSLALAAAVARLERPVHGHAVSAEQRQLAGFAAMAAAWIGPMALLFLLFRWVHPGQTLCTAVVGLWFFLPPAVFFLGSVILGARERKRATPR